jgi:hydrogenase maturation protease
MAVDDVRRIADAVLYEGYVLWPYRAGALKNQRRWTFGGVYPPAHSARHPDDRCVVRAQVLAEGSDRTEVEVAVRFLHVVRRDLRDPAGRSVAELQIGKERHVGWDEAAEREAGPGRIVIPAGRAEERLDDGTIVRSWEPLQGEVSLERERLADGLLRLTVTIANTTPFGEGPREEALRRTFCSAHAVLKVRDGAFVSSTDPAAAGCNNAGLWPVLVGEPGSRDTMLASPIILEDHPRIAPESPGDLFDGGEIDQLLTLSILSMTDAEKEDMRACDPRTREILERTEALTPQQLMALHGSVRPGAWDELERHGPDSVSIDGVDVGPGVRVRMRPRPGGDVFDTALAGREGVVESVEQDMDDAIRVAVVVDDDPGRDLGGRRRPGHRFFFSPEELEPLAPEERAAAGPRVLVAGIGNIFLADDGFGVALAGRLERLDLPRGVDVVDFGIRGMDLAYALAGYDAVVLLDAAQRGEPPGTLSVIEPELEASDAVPEAHGMDPATVLALARSLGDVPPRTLVVTCEPAVVMTGEEDEIAAELSAPVRAALDAAMPLVEELVAQLTATQATEVHPS